MLNKKLDSNFRAHKTIFSLIEIFLKAIQNIKNHKYQVVKNLSIFVSVRN